MQQKEKVSENQLRFASDLVSRHIGVDVLEATVHGSFLRGFNDPNSDVDVCFLLNRPVSDYMGMSVTPFFESHLDERRRRTLQLSENISRELGWRIMVSLQDTRALLRGIISASTFSLMAYESFAKKNEFVRYIYDPVAREHFVVSNLVYRCGENIQQGLRTYNELPEHGAEFKQERTFLGTFWSAHRLLAYLGGDTQHCRTLVELIEYNRARWESDFRDGFYAVAVDVIKARTDRSPFEAPKGVDAVAGNCLRAFVAEVLQEASRYLADHPCRFANTPEETRELVDMYGLLLDHEDKKKRAPVRQAVAA